LTQLPRVLLVDDNPVNLKVTEKLLQKGNVRVDRASDGETAVAAVRKNAYQLVLMDVQLPGIDGLEATRQIRDWEKSVKKPKDTHGAAHLYIVALTAEDRPEQQQACLHAGMDQVIQKPVNTKKLQTLLHTLLENPKPNGNTSSKILKHSNSRQKISPWIPLRCLCFT
jgi:CheY-like chemotaxis protein